MPDLYSIESINKSLFSKDISSVELTKYFLNKIKKYNPDLNSLITVTEDIALIQAKAVDNKIKEGIENTNPLLGIPIIHKDIFCTKDILTTCGSKMLNNFISPYSAAIVEKLDDSGCILLGKSNMDEFGMGSSTEHSAYGTTKNVWDITRVSGGSSGGSANSVAANFCIAATGSDTGGSIRQPASFCGVTGIKPTYGRISRYGMISYASSLDTAGFFANSAKDLAYLLQSSAGRDVRDSTSSSQNIDEYSVEDVAKTKLRIGIPYGILEGLDGDVRKAFDESVETLKKIGCEVVDIDIDFLDEAIAAYKIISCAEASSNLSRYDGIRYGHRSKNYNSLDEMYRNSRSEGFGNEVKKRIMLGSYVLSANSYDDYYIHALKIRHIIKNKFAGIFSNIDSIFMPVTPNTAFKIGENSHDSVKMYLEDIFTVSANLSGIPAISFPTGFINGMPIGSQLLGNYFNEKMLLQIAHSFQLETDWHTRRPKQKE